MKEESKKRLFALFAAIVLASFCLVFGQDIKALSLKANPNYKYDTAQYYGIALKVHHNGLMSYDNTIQVYIHEKNSKEMTGFTVCEKSMILLPYGKVYEVVVTKDKMTKSYLTVVTDVSPHRDFLININLKEGLGTEDIGMFAWDREIKKAVFCPYRAYYRG